MSAKQTAKFLQLNAEKLFTLAQHLVQIRSVNGNETEVAKIIANVLLRHGINSRFIGSDPKRQTLIAEIGSGKRTLLLNGHTDTVHPGDPTKWEVPPFSGQIVKGKLFGRGAYDMKGAVAAMAYALISLVETKTELNNGRLVAIFNYDEEGGLHSGIKEVIAQGIKADGCIVGEPISEKMIYVGAKGIYRFELITHGRTGHTAYPDKNTVNAVTKMSKLLLALEDLKPKAKKHLLFSGGLVNPGTVISGGSAINIFPDKCKALVDCRLTLNQSQQSIKKEILNCLRAVQKKDKKIEFSINDLTYIPAFLTDVKDPLLKISRGVLKNTLGFNPKLGTMNGFTDGNLISAAGIPCVIFGPLGDNSHSENEFVLTKSLLQFSKAYAEIAIRFLNQ